MAYSGQEEPIHGECISADATAGVAFTLYHAGTTTTVTLAAGDQVHVSDIAGYTAIDTEYDIFSGANMTVGNGERIAHVATVTGGTPYSLTFQTPHKCIAGTAPAVKGAGAANFTFRGFVRRA
jgi:hypothetical protein